MRQASVALSVVALLGVLAVAPAHAGTPVENPYQAEFDFGLGKVVEMRVEVAGVNLDTIKVTARDEVKAGSFAKCDVEFVGNNPGDRKVALTTVLLLEDGEGRGLEAGRITLDEFKVKGGKPFEELQAVTVRGDTLLQAAKVYVLVTVVP